MRTVLSGGPMEKPFLIIALILFVVVTIVFPPKCAAVDNNAGIANPASVNCIKKDGTLSIQKRGDLGEYGICMFEDNQQCEEWAMFRGECPVGGVRVADYVTAAARFCVITGGTYSSTGKEKTEQEEGSCTFQNNICDAREYYKGTCNKKQ
jgi:putative hemolysin